MDDFATPPETTDAPILLGETPPMGDLPADDAPIILEAPPADAPIVLEPIDPAANADADEPLAPPMPSVMAKWNEEWQQTLLERKDAENAQKAEYLAAADDAMKTFQDQRESKREAKMAKNRQDEQEKLEAIEADLENDNSWQRVCKMVELSHDAADNAVDVKRMRDVMILLKNEPTRATVLA